MFFLCPHSKNPESEWDLVALPGFAHQDANIAGRGVPIAPRR